jgi:YD repeat-containing protein
MKAFFPARLAVILLFLLACATVLRGQKLGDNPAYYQLTARCSVNVPAQQTTPPNYVYGGSVVAFLWDEVAQANASGSIGGQALVGQATTFNGNAVTAHILPNKDYQGSITVMPWCTGTVSFVIPTFSGFVVYINGVPASSYSFYNTSNSNVNKTFTLRIALPNNYSADPEPTYLAAGASNSMVADKPILYFGLGRMRNSNPAGVVGFRAQDFSVTNLFTPGALYFSSYYPVPAGEVTMINVPSSNPAVLRQILSREVLVDINAINGTSYKLDFYPSSAVTGQPGGAGTVYTFSGSPFVSYTVAQNTASGISVTRTEDAVIWETDLLLSGTTWTFNDWHTQGTSLTSNRTTAYTSSTTATVTVNGPASGLGSTVPGYTDTALSWTKSYTTYPWGLELSQTNTGGLVSNYSYNSSTGLLQWATKRDGTWGAYTYYQGDATTYATVPSGYVQRMYHPWLDNTATDTTGTVAAAATTTNSAYDDYTYQYVAKGADTNGAGATASLFLPASTISYAPGGSMYKKTTWSYNTRATTINSRYVWSQTENDFWDSSSTDALVTTRLYYVPSAAPDLLDDQPVSTTYPSGRKDSYAYFSGTWNTATNSFAAGTGNDRLILCFQGQTTGGTAVNSWTNGSITWAMDSVSMVSGYSTVSETVIDTNGRAVFSGQDVYTAGTLVRGSGAASTYDSHGRLTDAVDIIRSIGANQYKTHRAYTALLLNSETSLDGVVTSYQYDDLLRQKQRTIGVSGLSNNNIYPARVISTTYDAASRPVATFTCGCGTAATVFWYDAAGRVIQQTDPSPNSSVPLFTNYTYSSLTSTTTTLPSGATKINTNYADGRTKSFTGRALPPIYYDYTVNGTGLQVTRYNSSSADQSQGWAIDQTDFLGRSVTHSSPTYNWATNASNIIDNHSTYDGTTGLLTKSSITYRATGGTMSPDHLYFYDGSGRLKQDGLDLNGDGVLTPASNDRYVSHDFSYSTDTWGLLSTSTTSTFPAGTALTVSKTVVRLTGFNGGVMGTNGLVVADTSVTDVNSQASSQVESVDSNTLRHHVDITISGVSQKGWSETINGYNAESVATSGARTKNEYDSLGRLVTVRSRWNATTSAYTVADAITFNSTNYSKLPDSQTINSVQTSLSYAWGTSGPSSTVTTTDAQNNSSYTLYNAMGLPSHIGGTAASPTQYDYDALGRLTSMTTWRNGPFTEASPWPAVSTGDTTTWTVESATGLGTWISPTRRSASRSSALGHGLYPVLPPGSPPPMPTMMGQPAPTRM